MVMALLLILLVLNLLMALAMVVGTQSLSTPGAAIYLGLLLSLILVIAIPFALRGVWRATWWAKTLTTVSGGIAIGVGALDAWRFLNEATCGIVIAVAGLIVIGLVQLPSHRDYFQPSPRRGPVP